MSNSPSRNVVDEAVAGFIAQATRNMVSATSNQTPQQSQQPAFNNQMGFNPMAYNTNGMPMMPPNYPGHFQQQQPYAGRKVDANA